MAKLIAALALVAIAEHGVKCAEIIEGTPEQIKLLGDSVDTNKAAVAHARSQDAKVVTLAPPPEPVEPPAPPPPPPAA